MTNMSFYSKGLANFDPFEDQKIKSFTGSLEPMCVVAEKVISMMDPSDKDKRKADFITLLKVLLDMYIYICN